MSSDITTGLVNQQQIEAVVAGPGSVNRLFICTGQAPLDFTPGKRSYVFSVGPDLTREQFHRAIVSASFINLMLVTNSLPEGSQPDGPQPQCWIGETDADWDDEVGKVRVRFEAGESGRDHNWPLTSQLLVMGYTVHILAEL